MSKRYEFKSYEEFMDSLVGSPDATIVRFIEVLRGTRYMNIFDQLVIDVQDVRIAEYFDEELLLEKVPRGTRKPVMFIKPDNDPDESLNVLKDVLEVEDRSGDTTEDRSVTLELDDPWTMTMLFVTTMPNGSTFYYFYDESKDAYYSVMSSRLMTTIFNEPMGTLRELLEKLKERSGSESYVYETDVSGSAYRRRAITDYVGERLGYEGMLASFSDDFAVYGVSDDKGGRVTTLSTIGMSALDTAYEADGRDLGFEILAGRLNDIDVTNNWFYQMVHDLFECEVSLAPGFYVTGVTELEAINDGFVAMVLIPPTLWDSFEVLHVEDRAALWLWAVPITKREFKVLQTGGLDALLDYFNKNGTQLLDLSRRDKRFKFF